MILSEGVLGYLRFFAVIFARISKLLQKLTVKMPKVIVNLTDTQ
jgi:hypothetical protein